MTCKDCIHFNVCHNNFKNIDLNEEMTDKYYCVYFKDKSKFIELPCEIGTELFLIDYLMVHHRLKEYKFIGTRTIMVIECFELQSTCKRFVDEHFGKTVFLTKEEAEAKLKELNEK